MPVYVYRCDSCRSQVEKRQSFSDSPLKECEVCGGALRRVLQPPAIVFKGSGFYSTDNRSGSGGKLGSGASSNGENGSESGPPEASTAPKKEIKEKAESAVSAD